MSAARTRQMRILRPRVWERAGGMCEAGCGRPAAELSHALPRAQARVGDEHILDREAVRALDADEFDPDRHLAHLQALCQRDHALSHSNPQWGRAVGTVIGGSVRTALDGTPQYVGSDPRMRALWPREVAA